MGPRPHGLVLFQQGFPLCLLVFRRLRGHCIGRVRVRCIGFVRGFRRCFRGVLARIGPVAGIGNLPGFRSGFTAALIVFGSIRLEPDIGDRTAMHGMSRTPVDLRTVFGPAEEIQPDIGETLERQ